MADRCVQVSDSPASVTARVPRSVQGVPAVSRFLVDVVVVLACPGGVDGEPEPAVVVLDEATVPAGADDPGDGADVVPGLVSDGGSVDEAAHPATAAPASTMIMSFDRRWRTAQP